MTIGSTKWHFQAWKDFIFPINQSTSHFWDIPLNNHGTHVGTISILKVKGLYHICGRSLSTRHALRHPHWHQYLLVWGYQYPNCIHISNTSILKTHPYGNTSISKMHLYWQHINTLTAFILTTDQYPKCIHIGITSIPRIHPYRYNINTQYASILASHHYPKCIHIGITSILKGGATLASTCASSVTPTLLAPFPSTQPLHVAELLSKEKEINNVRLHLKESR